MSVSSHEQDCLTRVRFGRDDGRSLSRNVASLNILVDDVTNLF